MSADMGVSMSAGAAEALANTLLEGRRWRHSSGVARRAMQLAVTVPPGEAELLVAAAWLHDIGYSMQVRNTGFHPLDGADFLRRNGWPERLCALVAHHSGAALAAQPLGLAARLGRYPCEESPLSDALTCADQTTGPDGQPVSLAERMREMLARHGSDSLQARIHSTRAPRLEAIAKRVESRLSVIR